MRHGVVFVVGLLLLACSPFWAQADEVTCIVRVTPAGLMISAENGLLLRVVFQPLFTSEIVLENVSQLKGAAPSQFGVPTQWAMIHPCSAFADKFRLHVVATKGEDVAKKPAVGFQLHDGIMSHPTRLAMAAQSAAIGAGFVVQGPGQPQWRPSQEDDYRCAGAQCAADAHGKEFNLN